LFDLLGGKKVMIEWPFMKEYGEETACKARHQYIEEAILVRFAKLSDDARARLRGITDEARLQGLHRFAIVCPSLDAFLARLTAETSPPPAPTSSRRKKKS
jgi:hypothetical protein